MALPKQVQEQIEAAKALMEQGVDPSAEADTPTAEDETSSETEANEADNIQNDATSASNEHGTAEPDLYEQRYKTLQGMYNADKSRWQQQANELQSRQAQLEQLLASLSQQPQQSPREAKLP